MQYEIQNMVGYKTPFTSKCFLLYDFGDTNVTLNHSLLLANLFTAATILIASLWKSPHTPSIIDWHDKSDFFLLMFKLTTIDKFKSGNLKAGNHFCK